MNWSVRAEWGMCPVVVSPVSWPSCPIQSRAATLPPTEPLMPLFLGCPVPYPTFHSPSATGGGWGPCRGWGVVSGGGYSVCPTMTAAGQHTVQRPQGNHRFLWPPGDFLSMIRKTSRNLPCESDTMALTLFLSHGDG